MTTNTKVSLKVVAAAVGAMVAAGVVIWYFWLRKRIVDVNATVTVPQDEIAVTYTPTPSGS
jgi:O-antigen/teichoic acid export membrane protein